MSARRAKPDLMMVVVASLYAEYSLLFVQNPAVLSNKQRPGEGDWDWRWRCN